MTIAPLNVDQTRVGKIVKTNVPVIVRDPVTNKIKAFDLAELDDASSQVWLQQVKDWKARLRYRSLLQQTRVGSKT